MCDHALCQPIEQLVNCYIRERGSILYLGMAMEILNLHMLKSTAGAVVPSVTKLFNLSAQLEQLPQTWCVEYHGKQS